MCLWHCQLQSRMPFPTLCACSCDVYRFCLFACVLCCYALFRKGTPRNGLIFGSWVSLAFFFRSFLFRSR